MSRGYFNYKQDGITEIILDIEKVIENNGIIIQNEYDDDIGNDFPSSIINRLKETILHLNKALLMANAVDHLLSQETGQKSFKEEWDEIAKL